MKEKFDSIWLGIVLGLFSPIIGFFVFYFTNYNYMTLSGFINYIILGSSYAPLISLSVIANLPVFYIFIQKNKYHTAKGILLTTFLYAFFVFFLKFFI